jgi:hypothetical protein
VDSYIRSNVKQMLVQEAMVSGSSPSEAEALAEGLLRVPTFAMVVLPRMTVTETEIQIETVPDTEKYEIFFIDPPAEEPLEVEEDELGPWVC